MNQGLQRDRNLRYKPKEEKEDDLSRRLRKLEDMTSRLQ
jgi:hypothetical protein